jgi:hypothetical protein
MVFFTLGTFADIDICLNGAEGSSDGKYDTQSSNKPEFSRR